MSFAKVEIALRNSENLPVLARQFFSVFESVVGGFSSPQQKSAAQCYWCNYWKYSEGKISYAQLKKWAKNFGYDMGKYY